MLEEYGTRCTQITFLSCVSRENVSKRKFLSAQYFAQFETFFFLDIPPKHVSHKRFNFLTKGKISDCSKFKALARDIM